MYEVGEKVYVDYDGNDFPYKGIGTIVFIFLHPLSPFPFYVQMGEKVNEDYFDIHDIEEFRPHMPSNGGDVLVLKEEEIRKL